MTPLKGGCDVTYKTFKFSYNHTDKERIEVSSKSESNVWISIAKKRTKS